MNIALKLLLIRILITSDNGTMESQICGILPGWKKRGQEVHASSVLVTKYDYCHFKQRFYDNNNNNAFNVLISYTLQTYHIYYK